VTVATLIQDGSRQDMQVPLTALSARQVYQVFGADRVMTPEEQYKMIITLGIKTGKPKTPRRAHRVKIQDGLLLVSDKAATR